MNFPNSLDDNVTLPNPPGNSFINSPSHSALHSNANSAIKALETKLGIGSTTPSATGLFLIPTGPGTTAWSKITSAQLADTLSDKTGTGRTVFSQSPALASASLTSPTMTNPATDTVVEATAGSGVTVGGVTLKDGKVSSAALANQVNTAAIQAQAVKAPNVDFGGAGVGIWWEEIGRATLTVAADVITVSNFPARKYLRIMCITVPSGETNRRMTFNGDTTASYASKLSANNAAPTDELNVASVFIGTTGTVPQIGIAEVTNIGNQEKMIIGSITTRSAAGAGTAPSYVTYAGKWVNTAAQITSVTITNSSTGDYVTGTELIILGHN